MKKRIMVFMLLFAFLVGVVAPDQAKAANSTETTADDVKYRDIEDFMHGLGYSDFSKNDNGIYLVYFKDNHYYIVEFIDVLDCKPYFARYSETAKDLVFFFEESFDGSNFKVYKYWNPEYAELNENYSCLLVSGNVGAFPGMGIIDLTYKEVSSDFIYAAYIIDNILYSDLNVYMPTIISGHFYPNYENVIFESSLIGPYTFEQWCSDAGLNCAASSNETEDLYNFSFNPEENHYIIRRNRISGSEYTWYLSHVTKEEDLIYYATNRALADSSIGAAALYVLSGEYASGSTSICNYVYDSSGEGWLYTDNYSVDLGLTNDYYVDDIGITYSSSMPIVYSSTDIFSDKEQSSVYYAANTEYEDSEVTYPDISPTSTPTPTPISNSSSSGSGSSGSGNSGSGIVVGGQAKPGGLMELVLYFIRWVWTDLFAIEVPVDNYQISMQQVFIYGAIVAVFIWAVFGRKKG